MLHNEKVTTLADIDTLVDKKNKSKSEQQEIVKALKKIIHAEPTNSEAHYYAAMLVIAKEVPENAFNLKTEFTRAINLGSDKAKLQFGIYNLSQPSLETTQLGLKLLEEMAEKKNDSALYHLGLHYHYTPPVDFDKAREYYQAVTEHYKPSHSMPNEVILTTHLNLGRLYTELGFTEYEYFDKAQETFNAIAKYSYEAEYLENDVNFKRILMVEDQDKRNSLLALWLKRLNEFADKGLISALMDLATMYLKAYGENPYFNLQQDLNLAEKYLERIKTREELGEIYFLYYLLYNRKSQPGLAQHYLSLSAQEGYSKAQMVYGEFLLKLNDPEGHTWIERSCRQGYHGAYFSKFKQFTKAAQNEKNPQKRDKLIIESYAELEKAARRNNVDAQLLVARYALENRYQEPEGGYETRMDRAKNNLYSVLKNINYKEFPDLATQKEIAEEWITLYEKAYEKKSNVIFSEDLVHGEIAPIKRLTHANVEAKIPEDKKPDNENAKKKRKKKNIKPIYFPPVSHKNIKTDHIKATNKKEYLSKSTENFMTFVENLVKETNCDVQKKDLPAILAMLDPFDPKECETFVQKLFMQGNAEKAFNILLEYGVMQYVFPMIDFQDQRTIYWLQNNCKKTDATFKQYERAFANHSNQPKRNLSITYIYGYLLATTKNEIDRTNYKELITLPWVPEIVKEEITKSNFFILLLFIANRHPELKINPYAAKEPEFVTQTQDNFFNKRSEQLQMQQQIIEPSQSKTL